MKNKNSSRLVSIVLAVVIAMSTRFSTPVLATAKSSDKVSNIKSVTVVKVVSPKYDDIGTFNEGMARVTLNNKVGFINLNGKEIVPPKYDDVDAFSNGFALVRIGRKFGYIDKTGKEVVPLKYYNYVFEMSEGIVSFYVDGKYGFVNITGKEIVAPRYDEVGKFSEGMAWVKLGGKYGFVDKTGKEIILPKYNEVGKFSEGVAWVKLDGKYGFVDNTGREIVPTTYSWFKILSEGIIVVQPNPYEPKYELFDKQGNMISEQPYYEIKDFSDGLAYVSRYGVGCGYIDKTGKEVIPLQYSSATSFSDGLALVYHMDLGYYGYIDKTGKEVIPPQYDNATSFTEGLAIVRIDGDDKIINKTGKIVADIKDENRSFVYGPFVNGIAVSCSTGTTAGTVYGFIDKTGKWIVPSKYNEVENFHDGFSKVLKGYYGMIDKTGKEIIPTSYGWMSPFTDGWVIASGRLGNNWKYAFNKTGKLIIEGANIDLSVFSHGLLRVNGNYLLDTTGKQVVKQGKYVGIGDLNDGIALVTAYLGASGTKDPDKYRYGAIDKTGKEVLAPTLKYDSIHFVSEKLYQVELNGKWGLIKLSMLSETKSPTISVTINGTAKVGKILTAKVTPSSTQISYQWFANGVAIKKATKPTYKVTSTESGKTITVNVTGTVKGGKTGSAKSKGVKVMK